MGQDKKRSSPRICADSHKIWTEDPPKKITKTAQISTNSAVRTKKKKKKMVFILEIVANFHEFWGETTKKMGPHCKICKKNVLAHEFWGDDHYFGSLRPRTALQGHRACYFLWSTILAWGGTIFVLEGTSSDLGSRLRNAPQWRRAWVGLYINFKTNPHHTTTKSCLCRSFQILKKHWKRDHPSSFPDKINAVRIQWR